ncbi:MAG: NHL repeat-containing protein [Candidatus Eremiobacteraeota bacterium]|nr:NHL repeat-containing protein [Candidatus Eremiobacteraeota bacterium]
MRLALAALLAALNVPNTGPAGYPLYGPDNVVADATGNLFVTDHAGSNKMRLLKLGPDGRILAEWHLFSPAQQGESGPEDVALDADGFIYATDKGSRNVLKLSPAGETVARFGGFHDLGHVVLDSHRNIIVCEAKANRITYLAPDGRVLARRQRAKGAGLDQSSYPESIAIDKNDDLYVLDFANRRVLKLAPDGTTLQAIPLPGRQPAGIAVDASGSIYVPDQKAHAIVVLSRDGTLTKTLEVDGTRRLFDAGPGGISIDSKQTIWAPDGTAIVRLSLEGKLLARIPEESAGSAKTSAVAWTTYAGVSVRSGALRPKDGPPAKKIFQRPRRSRCSSSSWRISRKVAACLTWRAAAAIRRSRSPGSSVRAVASLASTSRRR